MKKLLALVLGAGLSMSLMALTGCGGGCPTMSEDGPDHTRRVSKNVDIDAREFVEDVDSFMLWDQPSHLSPFITPRKPGI